MVKKAVASVQANGKDKALAQFNDPKGEFVKGEFYIFALDMNGVTVANGGNQKLVGKNLSEMKDADGKFFQKEFLRVGSAGGGWVDYKWTNPETTKIGDKSAYVEKAGDIVLGCGFYK
jgi:signal transduction histidine kinase